MRTWGYCCVIRKSICPWVSHLPSTDINTHMWIRIHKDIGLFMDIHIGICYFPPLGAKSYNCRPLHPIFQGVYFSPIFSDFNAQTSSHQRQNLHLDVNDIKLLQIPNPHWLREYEDINHYNAPVNF